VLGDEGEENEETKSQKGDEVAKRWSVHEAIFTPTCPRVYLSPFSTPTFNIS
jgi:hypothetical protein